MSADTLPTSPRRCAPSGPALSAAEVAEQVGASRVTARRYLEHLADTGGRAAAALRRLAAGPRSSTAPIG